MDSDRDIFHLGLRGGMGVALLKAQICMIYFQTCAQIFGIHKALIHVKRKNCIFLLAVFCSKSQYMYEYIIETETPLSN